MISRNKCEIYDYSCGLKCGNELKINISVYPQKNDALAEELMNIITNKSIDEINKSFEECKQRETDYFTLIKQNIIEKYSELAYSTNLYEMALNQL